MPNLKPFVQLSGVFVLSLKLIVTGFNSFDWKLLSVSAVNDVSFFSFQRKSLLEVIKETVLSHLTKKCPPHVRMFPWS